MEKQLSFFFFSTFTYNNGITQCPGARLYTGWPEINVANSSVGFIVHWVEIRRFPLRTGVRKCSQSVLQAFSVGPKNIEKKKENMGTCSLFYRSFGYFVKGAVTRSNSSENKSKRLWFKVFFTFFLLQ